MLSPLFPLVAVVAMLPVATGISYRLIFQRFVRWHFGEENRYDRDAARRRKQFEGRCGTALSFLYAALVAGFARGAIEVLAPDFSRFALLIQCAVLGLALLFAWAAVNRWREPFAD